MLYDPARHEPLGTADWDAGRARGAIERIVRDTEAHFSAQAWWPVHPRDVEPGDAEGVPSTTLYFGAAGVVWALDRLRTAGAAELAGDPLSRLDALLEDNRAWLGANGHADESASYLLGDTPIEMMAFGRAPSGERAERLAALISGNRHNVARELLWGAGGTILAALHLHARTGDARWAELFRESAATLWSQLETAQEDGVRHWRHDLHGLDRAYLGAAHGFAGNVAALIRGRALLDDDAWEDWRRVIVDTATRSAVQDDGLVNWPVHVVPPPGRSPELLLQFCHGAPGFAVCLGDMPGDELDELLVAAGETIWAAGPLVKGPSLCHGTAGNGYAFLKLSRRTGDDLWLERARAFAMHGIGQMEAAAERQGHVRHSLWTGDLGLAVYLWACLDRDAGFPTVDVFYA
jgi:hypothetical protein